MLGEYIQIIFNLRETFATGAERSGHKQGGCTTPVHLKQGVSLASDKRPDNISINASKFCSTLVLRNCLYLDVGARISSTPQKKPVMNDMVEVANVFAWVEVRTVVPSRLAMPPFATYGYNYLHYLRPTRDP